MRRFLVASQVENALRNLADVSTELGVEVRSATRPEVLLPTDETDADNDGGGDDEGPRKEKPAVVITSPRSTIARAGSSGVKVTFGGASEGDSVKWVAAGPSQYNMGWEAGGDQYLPAYQMDQSMGHSAAGNDLCEQSHDAKTFRLELGHTPCTVTHTAHLPSVPC